MATRGYKQIFYITEMEDAFDVGAKVDGGFKTAFCCADMETASEVALAMNVFWQQIHYGAPDPALWTEFCGRGFDQLYGRQDCFDMFDKFSEMGLMPAVVH